MNPDKQPLPKLSDITPHKSTATSAPEMVESIPLKEPDAVAVHSNPISSAHKVPIEGISSNDKKLDQDLMAASQRIKNHADHKQKRFIPPANPDKKDHRIAHFLPVVAAIFVACVLSAAAYYAYDQTQQDQRLPSQVRELEASSTASDDVITPNDLETFSQIINTDAYGFDDKQDFDQQELGDQALGL